MPRDDVLISIDDDGCDDAILFYTRQQFSIRRDISVHLGVQRVRDEVLYGSLRDHATILVAFGFPASCAYQEARSAGEAHGGTKGSKWLALAKRTNAPRGTRTFLPRRRVSSCLLEIR